MTTAAAQKLFAHLLAQFKRAFPHVKSKLKIHAKHFLKAPKPRDFAWFDPTDNSINLTVKALQQPQDRIEGLMAHELGHAVDENRHKPLSEARADALAKRALGLTIRYDDGVQSLKYGTTPRPLDLPEAQGYRTVAAGLAKRMAKDGAKHFDEKVQWVQEHIPSIDDPTGFVGWVTKEKRVGGKMRNGKIRNGNLHCNCGCNKYKTQNPISVKGGEPTNNYAKIVARAYLDAPEYDQEALASYRALLSSIEKIYKQIASKVKIIHVHGQPYTDDKHMHDEVHRTKILYISTDYNEHPFFNPAQNLKFRAVHDWFAHIAGGAAFGQRGELQAYNAQRLLTPPAGWPAMFSEIVGQACYYTVYGDFPDQKVCLLPGFDLYHVGKMLPKQNPQRTRYKRNPLGTLLDLYSANQTLSGMVANPCHCGGTCGRCGGR